MTKKIHTFFIAHGFKGKPSKPPWLKWLKQELEKEGHTVHAPIFQTPEAPRLAEWIETIEKTLQSNFHNVIFIGHSLGGNAILRALEAHAIQDKRTPGRARAVFLVGAPFSIEKRPPETIEFLKAPYNWEKIRQLSETFFHIYSKDDPLVSFKDGLEMRRFLRGKFVPMAHMKHFDHCETFPKIKYLIDQNF